MGLNPQIFERHIRMKLYYLKHRIQSKGDRRRLALGAKGTGKQVPEITLFRAPP